MAVLGFCKEPNQKHNEELGKKGHSLSLKSLHFIKSTPVCFYCIYLPSALMSGAGFSSLFSISSAPNLSKTFELTGLSFKMSKVQRRGRFAIGSCWML